MFKCCWCKAFKSWLKSWVAAAPIPSAALWPTAWSTVGPIKAFVRPTRADTEARPGFRAAVTGGLRSENKEEEEEEALLLLPLLLVFSVAAAAAAAAADNDAADNDAAAAPADDVVAGDAFTT
jgi:hypothetical protein